MTYRHLMKLMWMVITICLLPFWAQADTIRIPQTGQINTYAPGDDGFMQAGVLWPTPHFVRSNNGTVTDTLTGLVWLGNANCFAAKNWFDAITAANNLASGACSLSDGSKAGQWRLPNAREMKSLSNLQQISTIAWLNTTGFKYVQANGYWSSSTSSANPNTAWSVNLEGVGVAPDWKANSYFVWPVRGGAPGTGAVQLPETGQTATYAAGDDGALKKGAAWPSPRFTDMSNGTVLDNLTGLLWLKNVNCTETLAGIDKTNDYLFWKDALTWSNALAGGNCGLSDSSKAGDWRMPNIEEVYSLVDLSMDNPALPSGHPFANMALLWSSSTYAGVKSNALCIDITNGSVTNHIKTTSFIHVWPVRNSPPTISGIPGTTVAVGAAYSFIPTATYADSFSYTGALPPGLNFNILTGALTGIPKTVGAYGPIVISAVNPGGSASLPAFSITVIGKPPVISASPASVNFGSVRLGVTSTAKSVTVRNTGENDLTIRNVSITGTDAPEFGQTNECGSIQHGGSCTIDVTFTPDLPFVKKTAQLVIESDASNKPVLNVNLSGQPAPPKISATPASLNFGKLPVEVQSAKKTVTVKNSGLSDLTIQNMMVQGTNADDFGITGICGTVPTGGICTIEVTFAPLVRGVNRSAVLVISSNDPKKPTVSLKLSGSGK